MSKNLLLTGGAGFIGHHTIEHILKTTDWNIVVLDGLNYAGNLNYINDILVMKKEEFVNRVHIVFHDLKAPISDQVLHSLEHYGNLNYVIHMAAESHVDNSITNPVPFVMSNVVGTMNMLEAVKKMGSIDKYIQISTDEVYGPSIAGHLHTEGEPHKPGNPYSASKAGAEDLAFAYYNTYGLPIVITNTMNNFGERQNPEKFVPKVIKAIMTNQPVIAHCKKDEQGNVVDVSSRCWLHARNHSDALLFLLQNGTAGERYNVTGERYSVVEMIRFIGHFMGKAPEEVNLQYEDFHSFRKGHDMHYGLDGLKLAKMGWNAPVPLLESLEKMVQWTVERKEWLGL
jgi:dTDP-glucose 4,6-dehydratase